MFNFLRSIQKQVKVLFQKFGENVLNFEKGKHILIESIKIL